MRHHSMTFDGHCTNSHTVSVYNPTAAVGCRCCITLQSAAHSQHRFPAPSARRKDVVNQCLEFEPSGYCIGAIQLTTKSHHGEKQFTIHVALAIVPNTCHFLFLDGEEMQLGLGLANE